MRLTRIETDSNLRITTFNTTPTDSVFYFDDDYEIYINHRIDTHWHPNFEIAVVLEGSVLFSLNGVSYIVEKGEGMLINSNVLHYMEGLYHSGYPKVFTIDFSTEFIDNQKKTDVFMKYIYPFINCPSFIGIHFTPDIPWHNDIITNLLAVKNAYDINDLEFELFSHISLCHIWMHLVSHMPELVHEDASASFLHRGSTSDKRIKDIIEYIHANISDPLSVDILAEHASISKTECFRLFKKALNKTPIEYINEYRLEESMVLLATTDDPISEICYSCGFNNQSYFGKVFKSKTGMSPKDYRRQFHQNKKNDTSK